MKGKKIPKIYNGVVECVIILTITCLFGLGAGAQVPLKYWLSYGSTISLKSGSSLSFSLLDGFQRDFSRSYHQYRASYSIEVAKPLNFQGYVVNTYAGENNQLELTARYGISASLHLIKTSGFRLDWSTDFEQHSKNEKRYRQRSINSLDLRFGKYTLGRNIKLAFYSGSSVYYNIGTKTVSQYQSDGAYIGEHRADGFHRARFSLGTAIYIGSIQIAPSFMMQREFNLPWLASNHINTLDIKTGKIRNRFNNYNVISLRLRYYIRSKNIGDDNDTLNGIEN